MLRGCLLGLSFLNGSEDTYNQIDHMDLFFKNVIFLQVVHSNKVLMIAESGVCEVIITLVYI